MRDKIGIFFIIAGIILIVFSFLRFDPYSGNTLTPVVSFPVSVPVINVVTPVPTGRITPEAVSTVRDEAKESLSMPPFGVSYEGYLKSQENQNSIITSGNWEATDYSANDITGEKYTVQLGDTLWEISEAFYGTGFKWKEILNANLQKVGFLPNGEQALIYPGQILTLNK